MKTKLLIFILLLQGSFTLMSQSTYVTSGGEFLFQFADVTDQGNTLNDVMRFTLFFHTGSYFHVDFNRVAGIYTGTAIRNVGYIVDDGTTKTKRRAYSLGIPLAVKLGALKRNTYIFGGGEYEWFFHYKEKVFVGGNKTKYTDWFSPRVNTFVPSVFAGVQFKTGFNIKAKFYLDNFMNPDYRAPDGTYPYRDLKTNLFYISLSWNVRTKSITKMKERNASYANL